MGRARCKRLETSVTSTRLASASEVKEVGVPSSTQLYLSQVAKRAELKSADPKRRKCFLSYHSADADEVEEFIDGFGHVFIPRVIGVSDEDGIDSEDPDYVFDRIRDKYLADSTVTIVLVGQCTWARRYVDWEIYSSLRRDSKNRLNGLLAITLPSVASDSSRKPPARVSDNLPTDTKDAYARWNKYPRTDDALRRAIEDAYSARTSRDDLIDNTRARRKSNSSCP
jgi:hypothetical protein